MSKSTLTESWGAWKQANFKKLNLQLPTGSPKSQEELKMGVCFWDFCRDVLNSDETSKEQKIIFLHSFVENKNEYVSMVAKMEMLPDEVFRKVLLRTNIDFMWDESKPTTEHCLRRLSVAQKEFIAKSWHDVYEAKRVPIVYKKTLRDFLKVLFGIITFAKVLKMPIQNKNGKRYIAKGAWLYNLAFLDFGFGLYKNGVKSDIKIEHKSPLDFFMDPLRDKTHENDFWVNKEDGIYYFFYHFCRSWMFFLPLSENYEGVKWREYVCPAFWTTILLNFWFFFGPFVAIFLMPVYTDSELIGNTMIIVLLLLIVPTMLWCLIGIVLALFACVAYAFEKQPENMKTFGRIILFVIVFAIVSWAGSCVAWFVMYIYSHIDNIYSAIYVTAISCILIGAFYNIYARVTKTDDNYRNNDYSFLIAIVFTVIIVLSLLVQSRINIWHGIVWFGEYIITFIGNTFSYVIDNTFTVLHSVSNVIMVATFIVFLFTIWKDEEKFFKNRWKFMAVYVICTIINIYALLNSGESYISYDGGLSLVVHSLLISVFSFILFLMSFINLDSLEKIKKRDTAEIWWVNNKNYFVEKKYDLSIRTFVSRNAYLFSMNSKDLSNELFKIQKFLNRMFDVTQDTWKEAALRYILNNCNSEHKLKAIYSSIDMSIDYCESIYKGADVRSCLSSHKARYYVIRYLIDGKQFIDAIDGAVKIEKIENTPIAPKLAFRDTQFGSVIVKYILEPIVWIFEKISALFELLVVKPVKFVFNILGGLLAIFFTLRKKCPKTNQDISL